MGRNQRKVDLYRQQNLEATAIILADAVPYGGEESLMVRWARLTLNPPAERAVTAVTAA
jgi:hypothetical protein